MVTKKDFCYILREVGDITDPRVIDEIFAEVGVGNEEMNCIQADIDANGLIDFNEFGVSNYNQYKAKRCRPHPFQRFERAPFESKRALVTVARPFLGHFQRFKNQLVQLFKTNLMNHFSAQMI